MPRYIDVDVLKNEVMSVMTNISAKDGSLPLQIGMMLCNFADDTPTADVQVVKHGSFYEMDDGKMHCSLCGAYKIGYKRFCSYCGARCDL